VVRAQGAGKRAVLIITGKGLRGEGTGILRAAVPRWLNEAKLRALILSIAPAAPKDGGGGALYVLLKRQR
jgi:DNA-nicking Smr family endonuclease